MDFEAVIGLEIHVEMKTKSKMFSSSPVTFGQIPNTQLVPIDLALPGSLPLVNKQAVINAIRVCHALHMNIDNELWFDRKHYFYCDLPKGYQITQNERPIGRNGYIVFKTSSRDKKVRIHSLHIEEDTCKLIHNLDSTLIDYNRSGIPLLEIVFMPELSNGEEAMKCVEKIRSIVSFLDVSDGKMEEGSLRCDVNISVRRTGDITFGNKVEIKNINTLANIKKAIDYEATRQIDLLNQGKTIVQETRRFDEQRDQTISMRTKADSIDYRFSTEINIAPFRLSDDFIKQAISNAPELAEDKLARYQKMGLSEYDANLLVASKDISDYFDKVVEEGANPKLAANWINVEVQSELKKSKINIRDFIVKPKSLALLIDLIETGKISNRQGKDIFLRLIQGEDLPSIIKELGTVINDEGEITQIIKYILDENPQVVTDYQKGKGRAVSFIVGIVMKKTEGRANPELANKLVLEELQRR